MAVPPYKQPSMAMHSGSLRILVAFAAFLIMLPLG
jgi:hypothetical protein